MGIDDREIFAGSITGVVPYSRADQQPQLPLAKFRIPILQSQHSTARNSLHLRRGKGTAIHTFSCLEGCGVQLSLGKGVMNANEG